MIKLNLGCGDKYLVGWFNVDLYADVVDIRDDITTLTKTIHTLGLNDPAGHFKVDEIYSAHSLMCVPEAQLKDTLVLWKELLKDGGRLVIETTDLDKQAVDISKNCKNSEIIVHSLFGDGIQDGDGLKYQFNYYLLELWLRRAGFKEIKKIKQPDISEHKKEFNLAVEAIK